jgi:septal ring factor EnvC (AmiA/AmiB activator)
LNYGVDIKTSANAPVKSIYSGEISAIEWLPGYRTIVIISHGSNFRSVYGNLQSANVHEGQRVSAGEVIGSAGAGLEGSLLHFEIWNDRQSQNPEIWLTRK